VAYQIVILTNQLGAAEAADVDKGLIGIGDAAFQVGA
jgi:hypothetical protein